jgi:hypothetical protein
MDDPQICTKCIMDTTDPEICFNSMEYVIICLPYDKDADLYGYHEEIAKES